MTRGILIAGNDCALSRAIETETIKRVEQFASAIIPNRISGTAKNQSQETGRLPLEWNPSSPISARTLAIAAENRLERIDEAILICSPPSIRNSAADLSLSDVDLMINDQIKGWFFLVKELAVLFRIRKHGTLALVYPDIAGTGKDDIIDILGPSALASFRAFTGGLLAAAGNEPYITMGFYTTDAGNEAAFAAYIFKSLEEIKKGSNGKLHKFGKFHFFR
ncbi:MAG: hypothetical protein LBG94_00640 [Treponema sp.]|jgi:hypothetical protein|nr:hypothetical protein [Treponema sp.]